MDHNILPPKRISDLLRSNSRLVGSVEPDSTVYEALRLMAEKDVAALAVLKQGHLVGIFSECDYARRVILMGKSSGDTPVQDVMITKVVTVSPEDTLEHCMKLMTEMRTRHLPVLEGGHFAGLVSIDDVAKSIISEQGFLIEQLSNYISGR